MNDNALQRIDPEDEHERGELVPYQPPPPPSLFGTADPVEVIAKATEVAKALKQVIVANGLISKISGKEYPRCEAWTLLGTMLGVFPVTVWTRPIENGWEARTEARTKEGVVVGAAEAMCLRSERNWKDRDEFALRSMAATRSVAKALRMPLGFVMTLSGFEPTPAEEMTFEREKPAKSQPTQRQQPANVPQGTKAKPPVASEDQRQRWIAELKLRGDYALGYCHDKGWLLPTSGSPESDNYFAGEPIEVLEARHVPTTRKAADAILAELDSLMPENQRPNPAEPSRPPSTSAGQAKNAPKSQPEGKDHHSEEWYGFKVPFGKDKGTPLGELDKKTLFGWWANFEVEHEYNGKPKKPETIALDERFREMLDEAGAHYEFEEPT